MAKAVKLADIAKELGVSTVTVSNALLGKKGVSEKMRKLIWKKAQEMGYVKSAVMAAQAEPEGHFHVSILISEKYLDSQYSFYWQMYQYLAALISKKGHFAILEIISKESESLSELPHILTEKQIDGIIVIGEMDKAYLAKIEQNNILPILCLGFYIPELHWDAIVADNYFGMYELTNYMIANGKRRLAFVGDIFSAGGDMNRYMGFCRAMVEHRIILEENLMFIEKGLDFSQIAKRLLSEMVDGVICVNDKTAELMIAAFSQLGAAVPEQISITGFDNFCFDWTIHDRLTTYEADTEKMAEEALSLLLKKIRGQEERENVYVVPGRLVKRKSVKEI